MFEVDDAIDIVLDGLTARAFGVHRHNSVDAPAAKHSSLASFEYIYKGNSRNRNGRERTGVYNGTIQHKQGLCCATQTIDPPEYHRLVGKSAYHLRPRYPTQEVKNTQRRIFTRYGINNQPIGGGPIGDVSHSVRIFFPFGFDFKFGKA